MKTNKHLNKNHSLQFIHYILFGITLYIIIAVLVGCSPSNGIIKSKCYDTKWYVNN